METNTRALANTSDAMKAAHWDSNPILAPDRLHAERCDADLTYEQVAQLTGMAAERIAGAEFGSPECQLTLVEAQRWANAVGCSVLDLLMPLDLDPGQMARAEFIAIGEDKSVCYLISAADCDDVQRVLDDKCGGGIIVPTRSDKRSSSWGGQDLRWVSESF